MATRPLQTITLKNDNGEDITYTLSGEYPDLTAGSAEQIISDDYTENKVPYLLRASDFGSRREDDTLVGGTVAWNQLANAGETTNITSYAFPKGTSIVSGHKYLVSAKRDINTERVQLYLYKRENSTNQSQGLADAVTGSSLNIGSVIESTITFTTTTSNPNNNGSMWVYRSNSSPNTTVTNFQFFDLTQMFGSTIADYIYSLEQATAGAGVAWFKALFPEDYYAYNAGELMSVSGVSEHKMVGFNAWDEEWEVGGIDASTGANIADSTVIRSKNFIPVIAGATYYVKNGSNATVVVHRYDASKNYLGNNNRSNETIALSDDTHFIKIRFGTAYGTTYKHDTCVNLSSSRNGEYEPYKAISYPLDDSLTLRGIPKLDASNNLYYDGDTYEADGTVTRRYGIIDLGTLTWSRSQQGSIWLWVSDTITDMITGYSATTPRDSLNVVGVPYEYKDTGLSWANMVDKTFAFAGRALRIRDDAYTTAAAFTTAMSGVYIVYELATPTTEEADPYQNPQTVDPDGTEEYVSTSIVPVGHETKYYVDLVSKLAAIPEPPTANGTYRLIATVSGGVATLSWVAN